MSSYSEALGALQSGGPVAAADLRRWIDSGELLAWSAVYELVASGTRIQPPWTPEQEADFIRRYLLRCIEENPLPGEYLHGGYEAAWELAALLKEWRRHGGRLAAMIYMIALDLGRIYLRGDAATRNRVLCGVMEHAFEDAAVRPSFSEWDRIPELHDAYRLATEWGGAHERN
jgi:hypothetical protein